MDDNAWLYNQVWIDDEPVRYRVAASGKPKPGETRIIVQIERPDGGVYQPAGIAMLYILGPRATEYAPALAALWTRHDAALADGGKGYRYSIREESLP